MEGKMDCRRLKQAASDGTSLDVDDNLFSMSMEVKLEDGQGIRATYAEEADRRSRFHWDVEPVERRITSVSRY
jgi:hypothetical protein